MGVMNFLEISDLNAVHIRSQITKLRKDPFLIINCRTFCKIFFSKYCVLHKKYSKILSELDFKFVIFRVFHMK